MYSERFFREGSKCWPRDRLADYPAFESWEGVGSFKTRLAVHFGITSGQNVFLANRSAQLVRVAARLMFRACRNVLTSDVNWPHWQAIVTDEAARSGQRVTVAATQEGVFRDQWSAKQLVAQLEDAFFSNACDGVFLPVINNLGIRLPLSKLLSNLKASDNLRFALVDAAQSFCQLPQPSPVALADVTITGCHKWLRGSLPLGIAVCGRPLVAEQLRIILKPGGDSRDIDDPLLRFTQQLCEDSVDNFSETVSVAPLFSANVAIHSSRSRPRVLREQTCRQFRNSEHMERAAAGTSWSTVRADAAFRSGIFMMRSSSPGVKQMDCETLRARFREFGVAISAYPQGLIRISTPTEEVRERSTATLAAAFADVA